jgi:hypothetical protein
MTPTPELVPITLVLTDDRAPIDLSVTAETRDRLIAQYRDIEAEEVFVGTHYAGVERRFAIAYDLIDFIL